ncbi:MAG: Gfo/Idh/MocA family oxidoreductase, partial [Pseudomonadota bacterium]
AAKYCADHGIALTDTLDHVLADPGIDGVVLATPHSQHAAQVAEVAAAGKHVFCEKPFTLTKVTAEQAVAATQRAGVVLAVGHNRRFLPAIGELRRMVRAGDLGRILHIEGNMSGHVGGRYRDGIWRVDPNESPAGGMAGSGIHMIDAMIDLLGPIGEVSAQSDRLIHDFQFDDTTSMLFKFTGGQTGYLVALTATAATLRLQVFGEHAAAELRGENVIEVVPVQGETVTRTYPASDINRAQLEAFGEAIEGKAAFPVPLNDVIAGVAAFEAVAASAAERAPHQVM